MNGKQVITTTKVPLQQKRRRRRRRNRRPQNQVQSLPPVPNQTGKRYPRNARRNRKARGKNGKIGKMSRHIQQDKELGHLMAGMMNPFIREAKGMRLKDSSLSPTDTFTIFTKGTLTTNSNGYGWIGVSPGTYSCNDVKSIYYSSISLPSGDLMYDRPEEVTSGSPFSTNTFLYSQNPNAQYNSFRIVSLGIRIRNLSTKYQMSGRCYCVQATPRLHSLNNADVDSITKMPFKEYPIANDGMHAVTRHITDQLDYQFQNVVQTDGGFMSVYEDANNFANESLDNPFNLGIYIVTQGACAFEWEIFGHYERKGPNLQNPSIPRPNQQGMSDLVYSMGALRLQDSTTPDHTVPKKGGPGVGKIIEKGATIVTGKQIGRAHV